MQLVNQATQFMLKKHEGQYRKGLNIPYSTHLFGVGRILKEADYDSQLVIVGLLHDVLTQTDATENEVAGMFGQHVLDLIVAVSELADATSWQEKTQQMIHRIQHVPEEVLAIILAGKLQHIRAITYEMSVTGDAIWQYLKAGKHEQQWYYNSILAEVKQHHPNAILLVNLEEAVQQLFAR